MAKTDRDQNMQVTENAKEMPVRHKTLEERASEYGDELKVNGEFDWGEPVGREIW
ncbi:hypothetical protein [Butyrivibrio sp. CB08]|uniref:hypothetical protein n=1 Tax=Butyrivibrio sp. CB08 TaxID=2364879 RepID=UPI0013147D9D|nr:hypothetical protein [Butyrivibrio sp. CB08]